MGDSGVASSAGAAGSTGPQGGGMDAAVVAAPFSAAVEEAMKEVWFACRWATRGQVMCVRVCIAQPGGLGGAGVGGTVRGMQVLDVEEDELDDPDFDPVAYINAKFPNEDALQGIDAFLILSGKQAAALDEEILESVRAHGIRRARRCRSRCDPRARSKSKPCTAHKRARTSRTRKRPSLYAVAWAPAW